MWPFSAPGRIETDRLILRLPQRADYAPWLRARQDGADFLLPWEPRRAGDYLSASAFRTRVRWAKRLATQERGLPLFLFSRADGRFLGAITLDNIRRGAAQDATLGYWIAQAEARRGYMREAVHAVVDHAFGPLGLSRIQAACLPQNTPSRRLLEGCGFKYEGVAQSYLQIDGRWRSHVLYARLREDRRGVAGDAALS